MKGFLDYEIIGIKLNGSIKRSLENITIRKMHYEDTKQVQSIAKTTWNATYEGILPLEVQNNFLKSNYSDESMKQRIERSIVYIAEVEERVVGFANYSTVRDGGMGRIGSYLSLSRIPR